MRATRPERAPDSGAAVVELVMVGSLLMLLLAGVVQTALVMHARNVFAEAAAEGARYAASSDAGPDAGTDRAEELARSALSAEVTQDVPCTSSSDDQDGLEVRTITCDGSLPLILLPYGRVHLHVVAHALAEPSS